MPKMKTHKATAKRFRTTSSGKLVRVPGGKSHLRRRKAKRVRRSFDRLVEVKHKGSKKRIRKLLPYLKK